jgi:ADP-L-glycero-D-manno-heptose 6-epimerase
MRDFSDDRILVTGGAGLIGSAIVWALNQLGQRNIIIADFLRQSDKWKNLSPLRFLDYLEADDLDRRVREQPASLNKIKLVFHLGACTDTTEKDGAYLIRNNFEYTKRLAEWALGQGARFVYASSAATYGGLEQNLNEDLALSTLRPLNMYGYSKHLFDCYAQQHGFLDQMVGLKYFNVFGPNEYHKGAMRSMVHKAIEQIRTTGTVRLFRSYRPAFADGCQQRDFLYVKDAVSMTIHLAQSEKAGGLFNIGSGRASTWLELIESVFRAYGKPSKIEFIDMPEELREKYQYSTCARLDRLRATAYSQSITPLAKAVEDCVQHYLIPGTTLGDERPAVDRHTSG